MRRRKRNDYYEKFDKQYFSQVIKININMVSHVDGMRSGSNVRRMALYLCSLALQDPQLHSNHQKTSDKSQLRGIIQNTWPVLKTVKVTKNKNNAWGTVTTIKSQKRLDDYLYCSILDGLWEQKSTLGKTKEMWIKFIIMYQ